MNANANGDDVDCEYSTGLGASEGFNNVCARVTICQLNYGHLCVNHNQLGITTECLSVESLLLCSTWPLSFTCDKRSIWLMWSQHTEQFNLAKRKSCQVSRLNVAKEQVEE